MSSFYLGGSRHLESPSPAVAQVVQSIAQAGGSVHVGCCVGADALVIASALLCLPPSSLFVFAISSASGQGGFSLSSSMPSIAASSGASVQWLAGGALHLPLSARLISRSIAAARGCSAGVFFSPGSGSLAVMAQLVSKMPLYSFGEIPAPIPGAAGQWLKSWFLSIPCWQFKPSQLSFI